ncbi:Glycosyltransferase involved in cell wall biosynthesis [Planctomycetales bacterium 10988]|nr:Glycosyltransferase involved in cell wall biosynthesis [Planctomycetales bacterium 10988]
MRILLATDAWEPQVCGVVRTLKTTLQELHRQGHQTTLIHPGHFSQFPVPFYPEIPFSYGIRQNYLHDIVQSVRPDAIHLMTEGPVGWAVRRYCLAHRLPFTTCFLTKFPDYLNQMIWVPKRWVWGLMRLFHRPAEQVMVATPTMQNYLRENQFAQSLAIWPKGVDIDLFQPQANKSTRDKKRLLYVGRVSVEKNIEAFLNLPNTYEKVVVGDGPSRGTFEKKFPEVKFLGYRHGEALAKEYGEADVMVFPSRTDTFGMVILESLACGTPVAAHPVPGPQDILAGHAHVGGIDESLEKAVEQALTDSHPHACRGLAQEYCWEQATHKFIQNLAIIPWKEPLAPSVPSNT